MYKKIIIIFMSALAVACSVSQKKFTPDDLVKFGNQEVNAFYNMQAKPLHAMDIYEVSARVVKYNLSRQLRQMELDLSDARLSEYKNKMFPQVNISSSKINRSKELIVEKNNVGADGTVSSTLSDGAIYTGKSYETTALEVSWNTLDFGSSYFAAKQQANKILIAKERRRKAIFKLLEDSHKAYWYVVSGQKYARLALNLLRNIDRALEKASTVDVDNSPRNSLTRQRDLLKSKRKVNEFLRKIKQKKMELADLMGLPADTEYTLYVHNEKLPVINLSRKQMDEFLFANHPDMRVAAYQQNVSLLESKIAMAKLFPSLSLDVSSVASSDQHLVNQSYTRVGGTIAWNLLNAFNIKARNDSSKIEALFAKNLRIASGITVLTAARIRELLYNDAMSRYADDVNLHMIEKQLSKTILSRRKSNVQSYMNVVKAQLEELEAGLARAESYSELTGYALSIASVLNPSDFAYDLNRIDLSTLKYSLKLELGRMPISWIRQNDRYSIPSRTVKREVDKIFKLWRIEKYRGVKEGGDDSFKPNRLPSSALGNYAKPALKPIIRKPVVKKPVIKLLQPTGKKSISKKTSILADDGSVEEVREGMYQLLNKLK